MPMNFDFDAAEGSRIVYIRPVEVAGLPQEIRDQASGAETIYALHDADGGRIALVRDRKLAFLLARENNMSAVSVH